MGTKTSMASELARKVFACVVSAVIIIGFTAFISSTTAWADEPGAAVAKIGNVEYTTLQDALDAANSGDTIEMIADFEDDPAPSIVIIDKSIAIDLAGHKITTGDKFNITGAAEVIIKDSAGGGNFDFTSASGPDCISVLSTSTKLTLESGVLSSQGRTVVNVGTGAEFAILSGATVTGPCNTASVIGRGGVTVDGGTVENTSSGNAIRADACEGLVVRDGSTITSASGSAISASGNSMSSVTVEGANTVVTGAIGIEALDISSVIIKGGTISGTSVGASASGADAKITTQGDAIIKGEDGGTSVAAERAASFVIDGGAFGDSVGNGDEFTRGDGVYLSKGSDGLYRPVEAVAWNPDTGEYFGTLREAFFSFRPSLGGSGSGTIQMIADYSPDDRVDVIEDCEIVLDLNGYTITGTGEAATPIDVLSGSLTVDDTSDDRAGKIDGAISGVLVSNGSFILENGEISGANEGVMNHASTTINDGTITSQENGIRSLGTLTVNGGLIQGGINGISTIVNGTTTIEGGVIEGGSDPVATGSYREVTVNINGGYYNNNKVNGYVEDGQTQFKFPEGERLVLVGGTEQYARYYTPGRPVAAIGSDEYSSLALAIEGAQPYETIKMLDDNTEDALVIDKPVTIDLAGYTVTVPTISSEYVDVTIQDSSSTSTGTFEFTHEGDGAAITATTGLLMLNGGTFHAPTSAAVGAINDAVVQVNSGATVVSDTDAAVLVNTIENAGIGIDGGSVSGVTGVKVIGGSLFLHDGTITATETGIDVVQGIAGTIGGTVRGVPSVAVAEGQSFQIGGGAFSDNTGNTAGFERPDGKMLLKGNDGLYRLGDAVAINTRTNEAYATLQAAVDDVAADGGDTVKLVKDINLGGGSITNPGHITVNGKSLTIDSNGQSITGSDSRFFDVENGTLTFDDSTGNPQWINSSSGYIVLAGPNANIIVKDVRFNAGYLDQSSPGYDQDAIYLYSNATATIEGGTIAGIRNGINCVDQASLTINDGQILGGVKSAVHVQDNATATINDGIIFSGHDSVLAEGDSSKIYINGGYYGDDHANTGDNYVRMNDMRLVKIEEGAHSNYYTLDAVAIIEDDPLRKYGSLREAIAAAQDGETIKMLADSEETAAEIRLGSNAGKNITIDLAGHTVSSPNSAFGDSSGFILIYSESSITLTDSEGGGVLTSAGNVINVYGGTDAAFYMEGGTLASTGAYSLWVGTYGTAEISGGTVGGTDTAVMNVGTLTVTRDGIIGNACETGVEDYGTLNVEGGAIMATDYAIYPRFHPGLYSTHPVINITDGFIQSTSPNGYAISAGSGIITVDGGTIEGGKAGIYFFKTASQFGPYADSSVTINGGTISGTSSINIADWTADKFAINGGKFSDDIGNNGSYTLKEGTRLMDEDGDGWFTLETPVAKVGSEYFTKLEDAVVAVASNDDVVEILQDIELSKGVNTVGKSFTLDLGGHSITASDDFSGSDTEGALFYMNRNSITVTGDEASTIAASGSVEVFRVVNNASLTVENVTVSAVDGDAIHAVAPSANVTVESGKLESTGGKAINLSEGNATVNGGTILGSPSIERGSSAGGFTINGGKFSDAAGNGEGYTRKDDKQLIKGEDGLYALGDAVAQIGEEIYVSLAAAVADAESGDTIKMIADDTIASPITVDKDVTIDLNGKTVSSANRRALEVTGSASLTIEDGSDEGTGKINCVSNPEGSTYVSLIHVTSSGDVTFKDCTIVGSNIAVAMNGTGTLTVDGAKVEAPYGAITHGGGTIDVVSGTVTGFRYAIAESPSVGSTTLNIKGGEISGTYSAIDMSGRSQADSSTVNITGGTITSDIGTSSTTDAHATIYADPDSVSPATVNISGGTIKKVDDLNGVVDNPMGSVAITDGTLIYQQADMADAIKAKDDAVEISGGWFSTKVIGDYLAEDCVASDEMPDAPDSEAPYTVTPKPVDKSALEQAITDATEDKDATPVSEDGKDLADGTEYVDQATQDALAEAIAAAQAVLDDPDATQDEVDAAKAALDEAKQAFDDAKQTASVDKSDLEQAIADATEDKDNTPVSEDGKDLAGGTEYVDQATQDALDEAIAAAQAVADDPTATQQQVGEAKAALDEAKQAFDDAKQTASVDKSDLEQAITDATEDKDATPVSADGKDQKPGTQYVDQATQDALAEAIEAAQAVVDDPTATQQQVGEAKAALDEAKQAFDDAKKTASVDKTALNNNIKAAQDTQKNIKTSSDGKDVDPKDKYVTPNEKKALDDAIAAAKAVADKPDATQKEVDDAAAAVKAAQDKYDKAKKPGKKAAPVTTKTAIKSATAPAQKYTGKALKPAVTVKDANGKTVPASAYTVTYANNTNPGTATATVKAKADSKYTGTAKATFKITAAEQGVYWLVNKKTGENLYTTAIKEVNTLSKVKKTWINKGLMWYAPTVGEPIYRLYNPKTGDHHFTKSANEVRVLTKVRKTWKADFDGKPIFYSGGPKKIWRQYSESRWKANKPGTHKFTTYNAKLSGWKNEGALIDALRYGKVNGVK